MGEFTEVGLVPEDTIVETTNLGTIRGLVDKYESVWPDREAVVNKSAVDNLFVNWLKVSGVKEGADLVTPESLKDSTVHDSAIRVMTSTLRKEMIYSGDDSYHDFTSPDTRSLDQRLEDIRNINTLRKYVEQTLSPGQEENEEVKNFLDSARVAENVSRIRVLKEIRIKAENALVEDVLEENGLRDFFPNPEEIIDEDERVAERKRSHLHTTRKNLARLLIMDDEESFLEYSEVVRFSMVEMSELDKGIREIGHRDDVYGFHIVGETYMDMEEIRRNVLGSDDQKLFLKNRLVESLSGLFDLRDLLTITEENSEKLFNLVEKGCRSLLFDGSAESWNGTGASHTLAATRNPKAFPMMIKFLRERGGSHTGRAVTYAMEELVRNPASESQLEALKSTLPYFDKVLLEWYRDPESYFSISMAADRYGFHMFRQIDKHLMREKLLEEAVKLSEGKGDEVGSSPRLLFFKFGLEAGEQWSEETELIDLIKTIEREIPTDRLGEMIMEEHSLNWRLEVPAVFRRVSSPEDKNYSRLPFEIMKRMGIDDDEVNGKLTALYDSKDLMTRSVSREQFLDGLLMFMGSENASESLDKILRMSTGVKNDAPRIRRIFRAMKVMEHTGGVEFPQDTNNLSETLIAVKKLAAEQVVSGLGLSPEDSEYVEKNFDNLSRQGLFEISSTLLAKFDGRSEFARPAELTREFTSQIIRGNFAQWRNTNEHALEVLEALPVDRRESWLSESPRLEVVVKAQNDEAKLEGLSESVRGIAREARMHVMESEKFDFTVDRVRQLDQEIETIVSELKATEDLERKGELGLRKRVVQAERDVVEGILRLENLTTDMVVDRKFLDLVNTTRSTMNRIQGLEQSTRDLEEIFHAVSSQEKLAMIDKFVAYDTDDPYVLLNVGVEPRASCQSWVSGSHNHSLPSYVSDVNKRVIRVEDMNGEVVARSLIKLVGLRNEDNSVNSAILVEPLYSTVNIPEVYYAAVQVAMNKSESLGVPLIIARNITVQTGPDNSKTVDVTAREAKSRGLTVERKENVRVVLPQSLNSSEYSDSLGGTITHFGSDKTASNVTIVYPNLS